MSIFSYFDTIVWRPTDARPKLLNINNVSGTPTQPSVTFGVDIKGSPPQSPSHFFWVSAHLHDIGVGQYRVIQITPPTPNPSQSVVVETLTFSVFDQITGVPLGSGTVELRNDSKSPAVSDVLITQLIADPPGNDLANEGEYVELTNMRSDVVDLSTCTLFQLVFGPHVAGNPPVGKLEPLLSFTPDPTKKDFSSDCKLQPGETVRILTRKFIHAGPNKDIPSHSRYYLERGNPVWNNTGDTAALWNEEDDVVTQWAYPADHPLPPPPLRKQVLVLDLYVNGSTASEGIILPGGLLDGDGLWISTNEQAVAGQYLADGSILPNSTITVDWFSWPYLPSGRRLKPNPRVIDPGEPAPGNFPAPDELKGALLWQLRKANQPTDPPPLMQWAAVGAFGVGSRDFPQILTLDEPAELFIGINDDYLSDNSGSFRVFISVWRDVT